MNPARGLRATLCPAAARPVELGVQGDRRVDQGLLGGLLAEPALAADRADRPPSGWHYSWTAAGDVLTAIVGAMVALLG